jgi:hypothetical protein
MRVVIDKATLKRHRACNGSWDPDGAIISPEWDAEQQALVYEDWSATAKRLLSSPAGTIQLEWLVAHKLVPMTVTEFKKARGGSK